jgi:hypothetical protein
MVSSRSDLYLNPSERSALKLLYDSTDGKNWYEYFLTMHLFVINNYLKSRNWKLDERRNGKIWNFSSHSDPCYDYWQGLFCFPTYPCQNCSLFSINLKGYGLKGLLPQEICNISNCVIRI